MKSKQDLEIIRDLMDELIGEMEPNEQDFNERLGKEPKVAMVKMEVEGESEEPEELEEYKNMGSEMDASSDEYNPEEELKRRIKKCERKWLYHNTLRLN